MTLFSVVFIIVTALALAALMIYVTRQLWQSATLIAASLDPSPYHPQPWTARELFRTLLWAPRGPFSWLRWTQSSLLILAWILAEKPLWPLQSWEIGVSVTGFLWLVWTIQYASFRHFEWQIIAGTIQSCQAIAKPRQNALVNNGQWWKLRIQTEAGSSEMVTSSFALWRARISERPLHPPNPGVRVEGWWNPHQSPVVWKWSLGSAPSRSNLFRYVILYGFPILFILTRPARTSLASGIAVLLLIIAAAAIARWLWVSDQSKRTPW